MKATISGFAVLMAAVLLGGCATREQLPQGCVNPQYWSNADACTAEIDGGRHEASVRAGMYNNRGAYHIFKQQYDLAVEDFTAALKIDPQQADALVNRAVAYHHLNKLQEALADLQAAEAIHPGNRSVYSNRALIEMEMRDFQASASDFSKQIAVEPAPHWEVRLAYADEKIGRYQEAIVAYSNAIAHGGGWEYWRAWRANAYREAGLDDLAHADDLAVAAMPDNPYWFYTAMRCYARAREKIDADGAQKDCEGARAPGEEGFTRRLNAFRLMQWGRYRDAIPEWSAAWAGDPTWPGALYGRGVAKKLSGDVKGGEADISAALARANDAEDDYKRVLAIGGVSFSRMIEFQRRW